MVPLVDYKVDLQHEAFPTLGADIRSFPRAVSLVDDDRLRFTGISFTGSRLPRPGSGWVSLLHFGTALSLADRPRLMILENLLLCSSREHGIWLQRVRTILLLSFDHNSIIWENSKENQDIINDMWLG